MGSSRKPFIAMLLMLTGIVSSYVNAADSELPPLRFGSVAMDIPAVMYKRLTPLTKYLSKKLNRPVILTLFSDMKDAVDKVAKGEVDLAYLTPVAYIHSREQNNTRLIVKTVTNKKASFQLMIIVRNDSPIYSVKDLEGKSFAFGDEGALLQRAVVVGANMPLEKFGSYKFLGTYDNIVRGVLNRDYDAGILKDTKAFKWEGKGIRILYSSPDLPPYNITASNHVDDQVVSQLRNAFLTLDATKPEQRAVIKALSRTYDGFSIATDKEYDVVRNVIKTF